MAATTKQPKQRGSSGRTAASQGVLRALGYVRVSTQEQGQSGAGLEAQRRTIRAACRDRGFELTQVMEDSGYTAKDLKRPAMQESLRMLDSGEADALVVAKLDRLSRSLLDFASLMERSRKRGWALIILDVQVDTTSPAGQLIANVMASFAEYERRLIGQRTKDALAVKRAEGVQLGRPRSIPADVVERILREYNAGEGLSMTAIADRLNTEGVPTVKPGGRWYQSSVSAVLKRYVGDGQSTCEAAD